MTPVLLDAQQMRTPASLVVFSLPDYHLFTSVFCLMSMYAGAVTINSIRASQNKNSTNATRVASLLKPRSTGEYCDLPLLLRDHTGKKSKRARGTSILNSLAEAYGPIGEAAELGTQDCLYRDESCGRIILVGRQGHSTNLHLDQARSRNIIMACDGSVKQDRRHGLAFFMYVLLALLLS